MVAEIGFDSPALARAHVTLDEASEVRWLRGALDPRLEFSLFRHEGARLDVRYVERLSALAVPGQRPEAGGQPGLSVDKDRAPRERETELTFFDFRVDMAGLRGAQEFSTVPGARVRVESGDPWRLSTVPVAPAAKNPTPVGEPAGNGVRLLLLEGDSLRLATVGEPATRYYGFEVVVHHREGTETFKTGMWSESIGGPGEGRAAVVLHEAYLELRATQAALTTDLSGFPVQIVSPELALSGLVEFRGALAELRAGPLIESVHGHDLRLEGTFAYSARKVEDRRFSETMHEVGAMGWGSGAFAAAGDATDVHDVPHPWALVGFTAVGLGVLAAAWMFTRLTRSDAESHPLRRRLLELVVQNPGTSLKEASRQLDCGWGTIVYHVAVLERVGTIRTRKVGGRRCLFSFRGALHPEDHEGYALLQRAGAQRVLTALLRDRSLSQEALGAELGCSQSHVSRILRRLRAAGLVEGGRYEHGVPPASDRGRRIHELLNPRDPARTERSGGVTA